MYFNYLITTVLNHTPLKPFVSNAETQLSQLVQFYSEMKAHFKKVAKFFSEDPSVTKIDEFFASFATFIADFEVILLLLLLLLLLSLLSFRELNKM